MLSFGSLWVGRPLSKLEKTSLSSFIYHGHSVTLYVYDLSLEVPKGVVKKNARDIISENDIFIISNSYGPFADIFRYKMIQDTGLIWTDTDNICLKNNWAVKEYIFGLQDESSGDITNSLLFAPKNSQLLLDLIKESSIFDRKLITWSELGPKLLTKLIKKHSLQNYASSTEVFYPVHYNEWKMLWQKENLELVQEKIKNSYVVQAWNQMRNWSGTDPNYFPSGSALEYFYKLYYKNNM
jgi:hypothetical protein